MTLFLPKCFDCYCDNLQSEITTRI